MFEAGELFPDFSYLMFCYFLNLFPIDQCVFMMFVGAFFFFLEGRHFKAAYGKDLVDSLVINSDRLMSELEKKPYDHLASHQNTSTSLQGQISLLRSHQAVQDHRINFALAREAEEADGRVNER